MNELLFNKLLKQYQDTTTVTAYIRSQHWVETHLRRLCTEFGWLEVGKPVKHTISGTTSVSKVEGFIINEHNILVDVGFGNIWYYECKQPTTKEVKNFDGHCLIVS